MFIHLCVFICVENITLLFSSDFPLIFSVFIDSNEWWMSICPYTCADYHKFLPICKKKRSDNNY